MIALERNANATTLSDRPDRMVPVEQTEVRRTIRLRFADREIEANADDLAIMLLVALKPTLDRMYEDPKMGWILQALKPVIRGAASLGYFNRWYAEGVPQPAKNADLVEWLAGRVVIKGIEEAVRNPIYLETTASDTDQKQITHYTVLGFGIAQTEITDAGSAPASQQ